MMLETVKKAISEVNDSDFNIHFMKYVFKVQDDNIDAEVRRNLSFISNPVIVDRQLNIELERLISS